MEAYVNGKKYKMCLKIEDPFDDIIVGEAREALLQLFLLRRNEMVDIFNSKIDEINAEFDKTGEKAAFSEYAEDINPLYAGMIRSGMRDEIREFNKKLKKEGFPLRYYLGKTCEISALLVDIPSVKIYMYFGEE